MRLLLLQTLDTVVEVVLVLLNIGDLLTLPDDVVLLGAELLLKLVDVVLHDLLLLFELVDLLVRLQYILRVQIPVASHSLVQVLLLLKLRLRLNVLLLQLTDQTVAELHLFEALAVLSDCL
jgi:hypothetical protein